MLNIRHVSFSLAVLWALTGCGNTGSNTAPTTETNLQTLSTQTKLSQAPTIAPLKEITNIEELRLPKYINASFTLPEDINWTLCNCGDFHLSDHTIMVDDNKCTSYITLKGTQAEKEKEFCITLLPKATTAQEIVEQDIKMVGGNDFPLATPLNTPLGIVAPNGSAIVWSIDEASGYSIDADTGAITKNKDHKSNRVVLAQTTVIDTIEIVGTFSYADYSDSQSFEVTLVDDQSHPEPTLSYVVDTKIVGQTAHSYQYDSYGNVIVEEIDDGQDGTIDERVVFINTYDDQGHLIEQKRSDIEDFWTWHYDEAGTLSVKTHTLPNGVLQIYRYTDGILTSAEISHPEYTSLITYITDSRGNVIEESEQAPFGTRVLHYGYSYDEAGNIIEKRGENGEVLFSQTWRVLDSGAL